ncbi:MAG TPA: hypothetical protein VF857_05595, partial [Spirochaetota bacterium]
LQSIVPSCTSIAVLIALHAKLTIAPATGPPKQVAIVVATIWFTCNALGPCGHIGCEYQQVFSGNQFT